MASLSVPESPGYTKALYEEDGESLKHELQDICQLRDAHVQEDLSPHNQAESYVPDMTKRLSMAWDLLKDIPGSIFTSFIQDLCRNRPKAEIRETIERLNSLVCSSERYEAPNTKNKKKGRPKNKIVPKKIYSTTKGHTATEPRPMKGKRELNAINRDLEYWKKISRSFDSDTHNEKRRSSTKSVHGNTGVHSNPLVLDEDVVTSQEDAPADVTESENSISFCKITAIESLSETNQSQYSVVKTASPTEKPLLEEHTEEDSIVCSSNLQSSQKSPSRPEISFPCKETREERIQQVQKMLDGIQEDYHRLLTECKEVLNSPDQMQQLRLPFKSLLAPTDTKEQDEMKSSVSEANSNKHATKRKLPVTETQIVAKKSYVETSPSAICVVSRVDQTLGKITQLYTNNPYYSKETTLKCKFCPKSDYIFKSTTGLKNHLLRHYNLKPMQCTSCEVTLHNSDSLLQNHEKKFHGGQKCQFMKTELPSGPPICMDIPIPNQIRRKTRRYYEWE